MYCGCKQWQGVEGGRTPGEGGASGLVVGQVPANAVLYTRVIYTLAS